MQGREKKMENYVGIDISKRYFDLYSLPQGKQHQLENNREGIRQCLKMLTDSKPRLIVMESTRWIRGCPGDRASSGRLNCSCG
jgi:hypothetical protein